MRTRKFSCESGCLLSFRFFFEPPDAIVPTKCIWASAGLIIYEFFQLNRLSRTRSNYDVLDLILSNGSSLSRLCGAFSGVIEYIHTSLTDALLRRAYALIPYDNGMRE